MRSDAVAGAPGPPDWGSRHSVVCAQCEAEAVRSLVAYVAQRITRFPELRLLVPAVGAVENGGQPDMVELAVRPGDWTLWPVCRVGNHPSGPRRVALLAAGRQWVSCSRCGAHVRLDLRELASRLPSGRALVA
jgi:hypothetical protein